MFPKPKVESFTCISFLTCYVWAVWDLKPLILTHDFCPKINERQMLTTGPFVANVVSFT